MAGGVAVGGEAGEFRAFGGRPRPSALDRGRIHDKDVIVEQVGLSHQDVDEGAHLGRSEADPLVVAGLFWQVGEHGGKARPLEAKKPTLGAEAEEGLDRRKGDQLGCGDHRIDPNRWSEPQEKLIVLQRVIDLDVDCGRKGVQVGAPEGFQGQRSVTTPILDAFCTSTMDFRVPGMTPGTPDPLESLA